MVAFPLLLLFIAPLLRALGERALKLHRGRILFSLRLLGGVCVSWSSDG